MPNTLSREWDSLKRAEFDRVPRNETRELKQFYSRIFTGRLRRKLDAFEEVASEYRDQSGQVRLRQAREGATNEISNYMKGLVAAEREARSQAVRAALRVLGERHLRRIDGMCMAILAAAYERVSRLEKQQNPEKQREFERELQRMNQKDEVPYEDPTRKLRPGVPRSAYDDLPLISRLRYQRGGEI